MSSPRKVLLAIDGSAGADYAHEWYFQNIAKPDDVVIGVHCWEFVPKGFFSSLTKLAGPFADHQAMEDQFRKEHGEIEQMMDKFGEICRKKSVKCEKVEKRGKPGEEIVQLARDEKVSMIVCGTRGLGTLRRTVLGSVSEYITHHATCPVVVVRMETEQMQQ